MHEKKNGLKLKSYGGIKEKYSEELATVMLGSATLMKISADVLKRLREPGCDTGNAFSCWLNGPYHVLLQLEREVAEFESKINADPQFSEKHKQMFIAGLIEPVKGACRKVREFDDKVMGRTSPQI